MSVPFKFWIRGSSTYFAASVYDGSQVPTGTESAPTTIATPSTPNGWLLVEAVGSDPDLTNKGESWTSPSGAQYKDAAPYWTFTIKTLRYEFPGDFTAYKELQQHLSRQYVYLAQDTYDVALHGPSACIPVVVTNKTVEHNYDDGTKRLVITFEKRVMSESL